LGEDDHVVMVTLKIAREPTHIFLHAAGSLHMVIDK
jgi:hypothetical protein